MGPQRHLGARQTSSLLSSFFQLLLGRIFTPLAPSTSSWYNFPHQSLSIRYNFHSHVILLLYPCHHYPATLYLSFSLVLPSSSIAATTASFSPTVVHATIVVDAFLSTAQSNIAATFCCPVHQHCSTHRRSQPCPPLP
ncbi:hypothetical protein BHE74_00032912 [Ensete ventricosum]|nr:hypothetical protein BHE74_00032912 [Ensete ventricosum]